jgi:hypothetical protein
LAELRDLLPGGGEKAFTAPLRQLQSDGVLEARSEEPAASQLFAHRAGGQLIPLMAELCR